MNAIKCAVDGCEKHVTPKSAKGLCAMHYQRLRKRGDVSVVLPSGRVAAPISTCAVDGCGRDATYPSDGLCQKHYFRKWRYGTTNLTKTRKPRIVTPNGYVKIFDPHHALADKRGYVYEHRAVVYEMHGDNLPPCEMCGKRLTWENCYVDHVDESTDNNNKGNLRPACCACNTARGKAKYPKHTFKNNRPITVNGETMTASEWARRTGVVVASGTILKRLKNGATPIDAVYGAKATHITKPAKRQPLREWADPRIEKQPTSEGQPHGRTETAYPLDARPRHDDSPVHRTHGAAPADGYGRAGPGG